jgi:predicted amidohydrolase YtcJ
VVNARTVLIVGAEVDGRPGRSVRVRGGRIAQVGAGLGPVRGERVVDARGGAVIPGLHDHHVHLRSMAAARSSVALDPAAVATGGGLAATLRAATARLAPGAWLRGVGAYGRPFEEWTRDDLDRCVTDRPARLQHRGGALWLLNSPAIAALGVDAWPDEGVERDHHGRATGRLWRMDERIRTAGTADHRALAEVCAEALRLGITGFTDATPGRSEADFAALAATARAAGIRQRLVLMTEEKPARVAGGRVVAGPRKLLLDDTTLPTVDDLAKTIGAAHDQGGAVAVHAVTAEQLIVACAAFEAAGPFPGDRVEHASVAPPGFAATLARLGIAVVTQPGLLRAHGDDYLRDVAGPERSWLYPCRSLLAAGVALGAGSDAPFGPVDPWVGVRAAADRRSASGATVGLAEAIAPAAALALYLGRPGAPGTRRRVAAGEPGDLCVLRAPIARVLRDPGRHQVAAVVVAGEVVECDR